MNRSITRKNKWGVLAGALIVLSVILSLLIFGQTAVQADSTTTLTVNFPGISSVHTYIRANDGVAGTATGALVASQLYKTDQAVFSNLPTGTYDVVVVKGAQTIIKDAVVCNGPTDMVSNIVCTLTVKFPGISSVHTYVKVDNGVVGTATGGDVENRINKTDNTSMTVLKGTYDVKVVKGAQALIIDAVDCMGDEALVEDIVCTLTVKFPGISSVHTYVKVNDGNTSEATGGDVENRTYKDDESSLVVLKGTYDVVIMKGAKTLIVDAVDCTSDEALVDDIVCTLTVKFPGISGVHTYARVDDSVAGTATGGAVEERTYKNDETSMVVLKGTYDVKVVKNDKIKIVDAVDCTEDAALVDDIVCTLTVKFPGISSVHTYVKVDDGIDDSAIGGDVDNRTYQNNETSMVVLKNIYDVKVVKNAKTLIIDAVNCEDDTATVEDIVCTLTVMFPGSSSVHTYVKLNDGVDGTATGGDVDNRTYKTEETSIVVLKNTYDVVVVKGTRTFIVDAVDCTDDTALVIIKGDQTINFGVLASKTYGDADFTVSATSSAGLEVSFTASGACTISGTTVHITGVGSCTITAHQDGNIYYNAAPDVSRSFTVNKKPITVTADPQTKVYGTSDPALTYKITSGVLVGSDAFTGALARDAGEDVGEYAITQDTLALSENYNLTYIGDKLTITQAAITVTADPQTKVYGTSDPALTYKITSGVLVGSDAFTGALTRDAGEDVGEYAITQGTLVLSGNYDLTYVGDDLTITQAAITVTADPQTKVYGASDPALTYKITSGALVGSDAFTGALTRDAGEDIGIYAITQGTLALSGNYDLTYFGNNLTINQASTEVVLTSSCNPSLHLLPVTFTATVAIVAPGAGTPTGTVTFKDGTTTLGTVTLSSGQATYRTPCLRPLRLGDHSITVVYSGDANFTTSTSPATKQTVLSLLQWLLRLLGH